MRVAVGNFMQKNVVTAHIEEGLCRVLDKMNKYNVRGLPVLENGVLVGIITSHDISQSHPNRIVADAMSKNVVIVDPKVSIWEAYKVFKINNINRLPVVKNNNLVGIITKSDILLELGKYLDSLTNLYTSAYIRYIGEKLIIEGKKFFVIFLDLDNFGQFNKEYGHVTGDECIKKVAKILVNKIEKNKDFLCRYGGDEFVLVSTRSKEDVLDLAKSIAVTVKNEFEKNNLSISISVGISESMQKINDTVLNQVQIIDNLINIASLASTKAKKQGCNQIVAI